MFLDLPPETDEVVASKVQAALRHGLVPVICVTKSFAGVSRAVFHPHGTVILLPTLPVVEDAAQ